MCVYWYSMSAAVSLWPIRHVLIVWHQRPAPVQPLNGEPSSGDQEEIIHHDQLQINVEPDHGSHEEEVHLTWEFIWNGCMPARRIALLQNIAGTPPHHLSSQALSHQKMSAFCFCFISGHFDQPISSKWRRLMMKCLTTVHQRKYSSLLSCFEQRVLVQTYQNKRRRWWAVK